MKRLLDISVSLTLLLVLMPVLIMIGLLVLIKLGHPIIFTQIRPGKGCKPFRIYKFRTMTDATDLNGMLLSNKDRLTNFGKLLRSFSLDELPELVNVLKGDMSLVGPRPLLMDYILLFNEYQNQRHNLKPGITGWAQVNGRNSLTWEGKFKLDIWYVNHKSFWLDIKILWLTLIKVFKREGIAHEGDVVMPRFAGNN